MAEPDLAEMAEADVHLVVLSLGLNSVSTLRTQTAPAQRCAAPAALWRPLLFGAHEVVLLSLSGLLVELNPKECVVCVARPREMRQACGHLLLCGPCWAQLLTRGDAACPLCRRDVRAAVAEADAGGRGSERTFDPRPAAWAAAAAQENVPPPPPPDG